MASGRFLSTSIAEDERLSRLTLTSELLYLKTIPHLDRDGMIAGKPGFLWGKVCPLRDGLIGEMQAAIDEWVAIGLVVRFESEAGPVLFFPGFLKNNNLPHYRRERPSRFPAPPGYTRTDKGLKLLDQVLEEVQELVMDFAPQEQDQEQEEDQDQDQGQDWAEEEDTRVRDPIQAAWRETYESDIPPKIADKLPGLLAECGEQAVIHSIRASIHSESRSFKYLAACARNFIAPAPPPSNKRYAIELPGVARPESPLPRKRQRAEPGDDFWMACLSELRDTLPAGYFAFLEGSSAELSGESSSPVCRVCMPRADAPLDILKVQLGPAISRKLSSVLGKPVLVEIMTAEEAAEREVVS